MVRRWHWCKGKEEVCGGSGGCWVMALWRRGKVLRWVDDEGDDGDDGVVLLWQWRRGRRGRCRGAWTSDSGNFTRVARRSGNAMDSVAVMTVTTSAMQWQRLAAWRSSASTEAQVSCQSWRRRGKGGRSVVDGWFPWMWCSRGVVLVQGFRGNTWVMKATMATTVCSGGFTIAA